MKEVKSEQNSNDIKNSDSYKKANILLRQMVKIQVKKTTDPAEIISKINNVVELDIRYMTNFLNSNDNNSEDTIKGLKQKLEISQLMLEIVKTEEFSQKLDQLIKKELENKEESTELDHDLEIESVDENFALSQEQNNRDEEFRRMIKSFRESMERSQKQAEEWKKFFNEYFARSQNAQKSTKSSLGDKEDKTSDPLLEDR